MNRRSFIQSLVAVFSLPANPALVLKSAAPIATSATAVPAQARSWALYMSTLHGECTPQTLQNLLNIPAVDAKRYVVQLVADGVLKGNPLVQNTVCELVTKNKDSALDKVKKRLELKTRAGSQQADFCETTDVIECEDAQAQSLARVREVELDPSPADDLVSGQAGNNDPGPLNSPNRS